MGSFSFSIAYLLRGFFFVTIAWIFPFFVAEPKNNAGFFFRLSLIFFLTYIVLGFFFPKPSSDTNTLSVSISDNDYAAGQLVEWSVKNASENEAVVTLELSRKTGENWNILPLSFVDIDIREPSFFPSKNTGCQKREDAFFIAGKTTCTFSSSLKNTEVFSKSMGMFKAKLFNADGKWINEVTWEVSKPGILRSIWRAVFFKPMENILIFFLAFSGHYLWIGIVLLTLLVKVLLLIPAQKGIVAQQKMQLLQPEIETIKRKFGGDQQRQAQEMMALWKKHGANPAGALGPMLIQIPVMIALFFVIKYGLFPHNEYLIYPISFVQSFDFTRINFQFFWMNLNVVDPIKTLPLAFIVGALQFWQMRSMGKKSTTTAGPQQSVMKIMNYILPIIVVVFSVTMPSAVALYWGVSTLFSVAQQKFLQKKTPKAPRSGEIIVEAKESEISSSSKKSSKKTKNNGKIRIRA